MVKTNGIRAGLIGGVSLLGLIATPALAQTAGAKVAAAAATANEGIEEIVVTAQRTAQSLQDVPIAVSAFTADALQKQQINNTSDLQLTLPNITFTKGNFTGSSFTIRGVGDLCVGGTCDAATAIHSNDLPLFGTRIFETEYFDLERVEVLRGPQGTLFGRNATAGVINFITAKPTFDAIHANGEADYGNFNSVRVKGAINLPITDRLAIRLAGSYLRRDGYTTNLFDNSRIDGRDQYAIRGSLRWQPTDNTTVDLIGYYFREKDNRLRIQKQLCQRDPTGVLGCLPARRDFGVTNANSTFVGTLSSREFLNLNGGLGALGLGSLYGPDAYANNVNPADPRVVNTDYNPTYFTDEIQALARIEHDFGSIKAKLSGQYQQNRVDSSQDYNLSVQNAGFASTAGYGPGISNLGLFGSGALGAGLAQFNRPFNVLTNNGQANRTYCTSLADESGVGAFGGNALCSATPQDFDRSRAKNEAYTIEGIVSSQFDGPFNFLVGGIYNRITSKDADYYVNSFGIDYIAGVLGTATALGAQGAGLTTFPNGYLGTPYFRNTQKDYTLTSFGIFGEVYYNITDKLKVTGGVRYNDDKKSVTARSTLASFFVPYGTTNAFNTPFGAGFDADPASVCTNTGSTVPGAIGSVAGCEAFQVRKVGFNALTGRIVVDYKITDNNLIYFSYSRGYKSGGVNPPLQPIFAVQDSFGPEFINSFEFGSKNTFLDGTLRLNFTGFYYDYKGLQLSRIVARTSVNDNVDATVYGIEVDGIVQPTRELAFNFGLSWLHAKVASDKFLSNPRDPSGGRSDAVIIKDITNGSNCAIVPNVAGNAAGVNTYVGAVNGGLGLRAPTAFPDGSGINGATGAFSICSALASTAANPPAALRALFATPTGALPFTTLFEGVTTNIKGNTLPQAPELKFSFGVQYTKEFDNGWTVVPRFDLALTGDSFGNIFNGSANRIASYYIMNAQVQINGPKDRYYIRGYIQNIANNNATTGLYVTDQSSGLFTNIFTLEPRRYGIAAGFKF